jgi:ribonuclease H / adenosylcobalamin/alpha-ribazole phosphatase
VPVMIESTIIEAHETAACGLDDEYDREAATATVILIRHAAHSHLGRVLSGRIAGIPLSSEGRAQAKLLARRLETVGIDLLQCSPVQRASETAEAIAALRPGLAIGIEHALDEIDFGDWAGLTFAELDRDPCWAGWNAARATSTAPNGESMAAAQRRAWLHIESTARANPGRTIAMVTHCDIIRAVMAQVLGLSLDDIHRFHVGPAASCALAVGPGRARLLGLPGGADG